MPFTSRLSAFARSLRQRWKSHLACLGLVLAVLGGAVGLSLNRPRA